MTGTPEYACDVFVSYCDQDEEWVLSELVPRLQNAGLSVITKTDFQPGAPRVAEIERAATQSRNTVLVLSPAYVEDEWAEYGQNIIQTLDPAARKRRLIPVVHADSKINLRIRPLVSVDLRKNSDKQWQRLADALDPDHPLPANPIQNLSLAVTESAPVLEEPGWNTIGSIWLLISIIFLVLLAGLTQLLLFDSPALRGAISTMAAAVVFVLGFLGIREDRDIFRRLSHFTGSSRVFQGIIGAMLAATLLLWYTHGLPVMRADACGPLGCKENPSLKRAAIDEFINLTPEKASSLEWTEGTQTVLKLKLKKNVDETVLDVVNLDSPITPDRVKLDVDYSIGGAFRMGAQAEFISQITGRGGHLLDADIVVQGDPVETEENIAKMQDELARAILERLGIEIDPQLSQAISRTPTDNYEAIAFNNEGVLLADQGDFDGAEEAFRAALKLDRFYSEAHANLGFALARQGDYNEAIAAYQKAIDLFPNYAPYHYNLGRIYSKLDLTDESAASLKTAIEHDSAYVKAMNELGNIHIRLEQWSEAREVLERGLELNPEYALLSKNLARVALAENKPDEALELLDTALQLYDDKPLEVVYLLAETYAAKGDKSEACREIVIFMALDPDLISEWAPDVQDLAVHLNCQ